MGKPRQPGREYSKGPKREMTTAWKIAVHAALKANKDRGLKPGNVRELEGLLNLGPATLNRVLTVYNDVKDRKSSVHVERISEILDIALPAPGAVEEARLVTALSPSKRAAFALVHGIARELPRLPDDSRRNIEALIAQFMAQVDLG